MVYTVLRLATPSLAPYKPPLNLVLGGMRYCFLVPLLLAMLPPANACSCGSFPSTTKRLKSNENSYELIFIGRPIATRELGAQAIQELEFDMAVIRIWKGRKADLVTVRTSLGKASCGARFRLGQDYLIFATRKYRTGKLYTNLCLSKPIEIANRNIESLNELFADTLSSKE